MQAFIFRFSALATRFLCPLAALALSNAETMGKYYLFISYFTFVVGVSALELAVPFSRKFLRCKSDKKRRLIFSGFLGNQVVVTTVLAIPTGVLVSSWAGVPAVLIPLFCLSLATEGCVNEVGRFFWNIGKWRMPSMRDFIRAVIFTVAIVGSVYFENEVLTAMTFLTIATGNLCILCWEWRSWGNRRLSGGVHAYKLLRGAWIRGRRYLIGSLPQFTHMQILGLQPLLERSLLEESLSLAAVGTYSFLNSFMQSAAGLFLVPLVANFRQQVLSVRATNNCIGFGRQSLILLLKILTISGLFATMIYLIFPLLNSTLDKDLYVSASLAFVAYISSVSAIFCSAISPLFTVGRYAWKVNVLCFVAFLPFFILHLISVSPIILLVFITFTAVINIFFRIFFVIRIT